MDIEKFDTIRQQLGWSKKKCADELCLTSMSIHRYYAGANIPAPIEKLLVMIAKENGVKDY